MFCVYFVVFSFDLVVPLRCMFLFLLFVCCLRFGWYVYGLLYPVFDNAVSVSVCLACCVLSRGL